MHRIKSFKLEEYIKGDYQIWFIVILLNLFGFLVQFSAKGRITMDSPIDPIASLIKPIGILIVSFWIMAFFSRQDYFKFSKFAEIGLYTSWLLIFIAYQFGTSKGGASRWIELGPISFMPSDMAKLFLTASLAKDFSKKQVVEYTPINLIVIILKVGITCFLIMLSNFSTSVLVFGSSLVLMFFGRVPYKHIGSIIVVFVSMVGIVVMLGLGQRAQTIQSRIKNFLERRETSKELNIDKKQGEDYQITRSLYAIATGGKSPKGPGKSQQKYFLSQAESDFIFAIIIEEYGIVAAICIPLLFLLLLYRGAKSLQESMAPFGGLLAAGLTSSIVFQAFINMFVSVDAGPVTGQPMPMISAGGTSLIFTAMSIGLILAVSEDKKKQSKLKEV
ncbi:cell division protein FtsW [Sandaracinomonas limnophila]|uniref:Probable peptidoglycan glycosyltransferase FtsW n=1 Tax=Sandaracinomonas limnophila TaxID=1862386 RepID=A0A437PRP5_9BACT|nr:FtsW/RodA/SpoVE family cell cycle protein [Sandaracinomonas limnophila]RVU24925.1 cell division protein FtsW [Sandaracinomonas limnophila]